MQVICSDNALRMEIDVQSAKNTCSMTQCAKVSEQQQNVWCEAENMNHFEGKSLIQQILPRFYWQMVFVPQLTK